MQQSRKPEIMADAAAVILSGKSTGQFYIDDTVLLTAGYTVAQINAYAGQEADRVCDRFYQLLSATNAATLAPDFFLDGVPEWLGELAAGRNPLKPKAKL
jgi:hypothetical protein